MRPVAYDHFYGYDELSETLRAWAEEAPQLCSVESIGKSYEGRDIWLVTLTNTETGAHADKPGFLIEANIHSMEWTGCTAALHLIHKLLADHGQDDLVTRALDSRTFYVIPRLNPDGAERGLEQRRFIRSSVRPYPRDEPDDGLQVEDLDGDGRVLDMRIEDRNGAWRTHPDEPKLLVRRDPVDGPEDGPFYRLLTEGRIQNYDGVTIKVPPAGRGPRPQPQLSGGVGARSTSSAAPGRTRRRSPRCARWCRRSPTGRTSPGTSRTTPSAACTSARTPGRPDDDFPTNDLRAYQIIGARGTELTGYPAVSVFHDFKYDPKQTIKGGAHDWMYDHLGVYSWTTEFWSPQREAGLSDYHFTDWVREHPVEDDLALIKWAKETYPDAYVDWYEFDHPELGKVELGGWDIINYWFNVPFDRLEQEVAPHSDWALFHTLISPLLEVRSLEVEQLGETSFLVRLVLQNSGWLPTNVTEKALERKAVLDLEVGAGAPRRRAARRRRDEDRSRTAQGPGREALDDVVGKRRVDDRPDEARVGNRGAGRNRDRHRSASPARRHGSAQPHAEVRRATIRPAKAGG